jgi:CRP/FNR family cyclic AMP-dependent transcriptional regulator
MADAQGLLSALTDDERRQVLAGTVRRKFAKGEVLFHEGDPGDSVHLIEKGHVAVRVSTALGDVSTHTVLGPGSSFGEQALLAPDARRTATAAALDPVETRVLHRDQFAALVDTHPKVALVLVELLAAQVRRLSDRLVEALFVPAETRVMRRVLDLVTVFGDGAPIAVTQEDIATMAGTTRPTANRVLKAAEDAGAVALTRGRIEVLDRDTLAARAR